MKSLPRQLELAIRLAIDAHSGQKDKIGDPYILHPISVMQSAPTIEEKIVAVLHDTLEDTYVISKDLKHIGISPELIEAVEAITKKDSETYMEFIERVSANDLARKVKLLDIKHNLDPERLLKLDTDIREYIMKKYNKAAWYLFSVGDVLPLDYIV